MNKPNPPQVREFRIAPAKKGRPAAYFWKFWAVGNEIYATTRNPGTQMKISVHESGQIHVRISDRHTQQLALPLVMGHGKWLHAFEIRFLLGQGAFFPPPQKFEGKKRAYLVEVPDDSALIMNLLVGYKGSSGTMEMPAEFLPAAQVMWRTHLKDKRPGLLIGRVLKMDTKNQYEMMRIRQEIRVTVKSSNEIEKSYFEASNFNWHPAGGNVIAIVPMGREGFRSQDETLSTVDESIPVPRTFVISNPSVSVPIFAPNGAEVATLAITGTTRNVDLVKGVELRCSIGRVILSLNSDKLMFGASFRIRGSQCRCIPTIDGTQPLNWTYSVYASFDGKALKVEIQKLCVSLRNGNLPTPMRRIKDAEEIVFGAPADELILKATASLPNCSRELDATLLLRDI